MKTRILYTVVAVLVIALGYCGWRYYDDVIRPEKQIAEADSSQNELFSEIRPTVTEGSGKTSDDATVMTESDPLAPAEEINESTTAWLTIPGTHIDYPVVQGEDNDFYLHHGFDGELNQELGCPFLDCRCESSFRGFNSIVYAHHMTKQRMFADIALFKDEAFMRSCPEGYLTLADGVKTIRFFAYLTVPSSAAVYQVVSAEEERDEYIEYILNTANYHFDIEIDENSRLILLSTCTYEYDQARGVLVGVIE